MNNSHITDVHQGTSISVGRIPRNLLTHEYFGIDLEIVWKTVKDDLPALIEAARAILGKRMN